LLRLATLLAVAKTVKASLTFSLFYRGMTTTEIDTLPEGALLNQKKTTGRLIVTRNDAQEIALVHLATD
jgi:hypothetical protein